jgi:hypothetical protein
MRVCLPSTFCELDLVFGLLWLSAACAGPILPAAERGRGSSTIYIVNVPFSYNGNSYDARVDHNFSERTKIFAKLNTSRYEVVQGAVMGPIVGDGATAPGLYDHGCPEPDTRF